MRSQKVEILPTEDGKGDFTVRSESRKFVKSVGKPQDIVFRDDSYFAFYEKWSGKEARLLSYKYLYQRIGSENWFMHYDMEEWEKPGHPKHHLQISKLGKEIRLPTGQVRCEEVVKALIIQNIVR